MDDVLLWRSLFAAAWVFLPTMIGNFMRGDARRYYDAARKKHDFLFVPPMAFGIVWTILFVLLLLAEVCLKTNKHRL
jgi:tryptophan-rich sensory protein